MGYIKENNTINENSSLKEGEISEVGNIKYNESTTISFFIDCYKGTRYANIRAFVISKGYTGPSSKGIILTKEELEEIVFNCKSLNLDNHKTEEKIICNFKRTKYKNTKISVRINLYKGKYGLDIRETYLDTGGELRYGKGIRIKIECAKRAIYLLRQMLERFKVESGVENLSTREIINQTFFFAGKVCGKKINSKYFDNINLSEMDFTVRFINCLKEQTQLRKLTDLLNTDYVDLILLPNCGEKSIRDARNTILNNLDIEDLQFYNEKDIQIELSENNNDQHFSSSIKFLSNYLTESQLYDTEFNNEVLLNTDLKEIDFESRFTHVLFQMPQLKTVKDLLTMSPLELLQLENCGNKSIRKAQDLIFSLFSGNLETGFSKEKNIDDNIVSNLKLIIKDKRNLEIFLKYYNHNDLRKISLEEIGNQYDLTRERVRQIVESVSRKISKNKHIFSYLINEMKAFGYIYELSGFINYLTDEKKCLKENVKFLELMIKEFNNNWNDISIKRKYVLTKKLEVLSPEMKLISKMISEKITASHDAIEISDIVVFLKENIEGVRKNEIDRLLNLYSLTFISEEYKKFHIVENKVYNEMMYQIRFGKLLKDVVYWSLKLFSVPIHFLQLAEFIRKNNINHNDSPDGSIHSTLMNSKYFMLAGYGTYVLKDSKFEKYYSAADAIINLLREKGSLTESKILENLDSKYSYSNLKLALKNNLNKRLIKIGNDLYDIKNQ